MAADWTCATSLRLYRRSMIVMGAGLLATVLPGPLGVLVMLAGALGQLVGLVGFAAQAPRGELGMRLFLLFGLSTGSVAIALWGARDSYYGEASGLTALLAVLCQLAAVGVFYAFWFHAAEVFQAWHVTEHLRVPMFLGLLGAFVRPLLSAIAMSPLLAAAISLTIAIPALVTFWSALTMLQRTVDGRSAALAA